MRFLGNIEAKTDVKGRAFLPSAFRKVLGTSGEISLVLRKDVFQPCLVLYPESVWNEQMDTLRSRLNRWNREHQEIYRTMLEMEQKGTGVDITTVYSALRKRKTAEGKTRKRI